MAMPNLVKMWPRGYSGGQANSSVQYDTREGDPEVVALFARYTGPGSPSTSWEFRKQVIAAAMRLFKSNGNWFMKQDANAAVQEYNYLFLQDTLHFIAKGYRHIGIYNWQDLLTHSPEEGLKNAASRHEITDKFKELALNASIEALLQKWCMWPKGFDDLMFSLHLMFGRMDMRYDEDEDDE